MNALARFGALAILCCSSLSVQAKWKADYANADPGIKQWYSAQRNKNGGWCCDNADGHDFYGDYKLDTDGSVEFDADGVHHKLPPFMVLNGPNPTGHAVWWYIVQQDGTYHDYCFALGPAG